MLCLLYFTEGRESSFSSVSRSKGTIVRRKCGMIAQSLYAIGRSGVVTRGLKWLLDAEAIYVRPRLSLELARWGLSFISCANSGACD